MLEDYIAAQSPEDVIQIRVQQLGIAKVLINVHKRSMVILVKASTNIGYF